MPTIGSMRACLALFLTALLGACAAPQSTRPADRTASAATLAQLERVSWGVNASTLRQVQAQGWDAWLAGQLHPQPAVLPAPVQARIDAMAINRSALPQLVQDIEQRRKAAEAMAVANPAVNTDPAAVDDAKKLAQQAYQQEMNTLAREAASAALLRALYSPNQLQEQMTWFWMNHFSVHQGKSNLRALVGDYERHAISPHALGKFRALLGAVAHHPAMLRYLDNEANAANRINENYARELMELHTLGVDGGYSQRDVQELARILTGVGVNLGVDAPKVPAKLQAQYLRQGLFEFNPGRHDYGDKQFLGQPVQGRGLAELDEALDRLARHPATARFISRKLAMFLAADEPPAALVERMAQTFLRSDGDIAATLGTLFASAEWRQSLGTKFKDPVHYVVSALRLAYDDKPILNTAPALNWLSRMGEALHNRQTPDGYPLTGAAWSSAGQMATRFDIARAIGSSSAGLFKSEVNSNGAAPQEERPAFPQLASALYYQSLSSRLGPATVQALEQAGSAQEWNIFLLSSPEMMYR